MAGGRWARDSRGARGGAEGSRGGQMGARGGPKGRMAGQMEGRGGPNCRMAGQMEGRGGQMGAVWRQPGRLAGRPTVGGPSVGVSGYRRPGERVA
jgi:hypothetical protein